MRKTLLTLAALMLTLVGSAQIKWINPLDSGAVVHGQGWQELRSGYNRLPDTVQGSVPEKVWSLSRQSAGLSLVFRSNAQQIIVRYQTTVSRQVLNNMAPIAHSGVDMYALDQNGSIRWVAPHFPPSFKDTIVFNFDAITYPKGAEGFEYHLYLPLYNGLKWLEIGVAEGAMLKFHPETLEKPIVVYGTSIVQGASGSRPGMCWTAMLERELGHPVVNLGFSGVAKLEPEVFEVMSGINAKLFIIDAMPNNSRATDITEKILTGIRIIRSKSKAPILLVEHCGYPGEDVSVERAIFREANKQLREAYDLARKLEYGGIHYLTFEEIAIGMDGTIDGVHPNDLGMRHQADAIERKVRKILHEETTIFQPCTQQRDFYDWRNRFEETLLLCDSVKPQVVLLGDSITHFWGGEPESTIRRGQDSWEKLWRGKRVLNMGFGWDRIENVLWRIFHGCLDGYEAEDVLILIGTNNIYYQDADGISSGINQIVDAVRLRQPKARIWVCGILPRTDRPQQVVEINAAIKANLNPEARYIDISPGFIDKGGNVRSELFKDGLHPMNEGYELMGKQIGRSLK